MSRHKKRIVRKVMFTLVTVVLIAVIAFLTFKFFLSKEKTLDQNTFVFAILEKDEDDVEYISSLFVIDISDKNKEVQIISVPSGLKCDVPGVSIDKIGDLYPFGGGKLIVDSLSEKLSLSIGYYIIISEDYLENFLDNITPIKMSFVEDIDINNFSFKKGETVLDSSQIKSLLSYDYSKDYYKEAQVNKLYIAKEIFSDLKDKEINLFDFSASSAIETNIDSSHINLINFYFLDSSTKFYYDCLGMSYFDRVNKNLKKIILENSYSNIELLGIEKFYKEPAKEEQKEEKPAMEKEKEDIEVAEEEVTEEQKTRENLKIQVLNGNRISGSAAATANKVEELGFKVFDVGNVEDGKVYENSLIYYKSDMDDFANEIGQYLGIDESFIENFEDEAVSDFDILIIVGMDYRKE